MKRFCLSVCAFFLLLSPALNSSSYKNAKSLSGRDVHQIVSCSPASGVTTASTAGNLKSSGNLSSKFVPGKAGQNVNNMGRGGTLTAILSGDQEAPGPGDPDGSGYAVLSFKPGQGTISYEIFVENIDPATVGHIHIGPVGSSGPVVAPLEAPVDGYSIGEVVVDPGLIRDIRKNPELYYVNIHNLEYPAGAIRGQLTK